VLVPRPDTETLVEVALTRTQSRSLYGRALDLCTGSGCVAVSFALERRTWRVTGLDVSDGAARLARENSERLGAAFTTRWLVGDLFEPLDTSERFELITANPPYIPKAELATLDADVRDFEPHLALDGGEDGLSLLRRVIEAAPNYLEPGGVLAVEVGHDQASRVSELFSARGFRAIEQKRDYGRIERVVSGSYGPP
jgi:release factor glutamine methyltransferase